jgi:hypothetical protein
MSNAPPWSRPTPALAQSKYVVCAMRGQKCGFRFIKTIFFCGIYRSRLAVRSATIDSVYSHYLSAKARQPPRPLLICAFMVRFHDAQRQRGGAQATV